MIRLWKLLALPFFLGLLFLSIYLYSYLGGYKPVEVILSQEQERNVIFKNHRGAYHTINETITTVETWAKAHGLKCTESFGEYLDDPEVTPEGQLHSRGGCVLEMGEIAADLPADFIKETFSPGEFVKASFAGSPAIGPWKVYPKLKEFIQKQMLKASPSSLELYKILGPDAMTTEYLIRIDREIK